MQDPLKNKAFVAAYSYQAHRRFLTPENVDQLVTHLTQIQIQRKQKVTKPSRNAISFPLNLAKLQQGPPEPMFVDNFIQQQALPTFWEQPLSAETRGARSSLHSQVRRHWKHAEPSGVCSSPRIRSHRRLASIESSFSPISGKRPQSLSKPARNVPKPLSYRHTVGCDSGITRDLAYEPVAVGSADSTETLHSIARNEMVKNVHVLAEPSSASKCSRNTVGCTAGSCSNMPQQQTAPGARHDHESWHHQTECSNW